MSNIWTATEDPYFTPVSDECELCAEKECDCPPGPFSKLERCILEQDGTIESRLEAIRWLRGRA